MKTLAVLALLVVLAAPLSAQTGDRTRAVVVVSAAVWSTSVVALRQVNEIHHFYYGVALAWPKRLPMPVRLLGLWWVLDDTYQHMRQLTDRSYESPWHRWYVGFVRSF